MSGSGLEGSGLVGFEVSVELGGSGLVRFGIQGSCGACFKAHLVRGSTLVWFMALGWGCMSGSGLGGSGLGARGSGLGARGAWGSWGSVFQALVVHASRLIEFEIQGSCVSWLEARGLSRARGSKARWGLGLALGLGLEGSGLVGFGIQGSCGSCFKVHQVRGSRLVWFMARGLGIHVGLGARGVRDSRLVWCMLQGSSSSRFKARVVHGSRLGVHVGLWARTLGARGARCSCRARCSETWGSWGSGFKARVACFKAHGVRGSRVVWFRALGSGFMSGSGLGAQWLGARRLGARGARGSWGSGFKARVVHASCHGR
jgi:hypothetical protein